MANQTARGKAFEFACLNALKETLETNQVVVLEKTTALQTAFDFYSNIDRKLRSKLDLAANAAVKIVLRLEPQLLHPESNVPLYLSIQEDARGISGDVRDIICIRKQNEWEIGFSCKHNHTAVKHSRLSNSIDFGMLWFGKPCSGGYFEEIAPIFEMLSYKRQQGLKWSDLADKENSVYVPILRAFAKELRLLDEKYPSEISAALLSYLLGKNDFYKIITQDSKKTTQIQGYNMHGTLNKAAKDTKAATNVALLKLPTRLFDISFKPNSNNTIVVTCDGGWALSFRIHNASSAVEPSLKFDVRLVGVPPSLFSQTELW